MVHRDKQKCRLLEVLEQAQSSNSSLKRQAQYVVEDAEYAEGLTRSLIPVVRSIGDDAALPPDLWTDLTDAWTEQDRQARSLLGGIASSSSAATTAAASLTTTATTRVLSGWMPKSSELDALRTQLQRPARVERVRELMRQLGLDRARTDSRSALDLLNEATSALVQPASHLPGATSVLIGARSAIELTLADLLPRRPVQESARKADAKVTSIGRQCGCGDLDAQHFDRLGRDLTRLREQLSRGKTAAVPAAEVRTLFDSALQFLQAFLEGLEQGKLS